MEIGGKSIKFLDLDIKINTNVNNDVNKIFHFIVYRKPSFTDTTIIINDSFRPFNHKISAYLSMLHRTISLPLTKDNFHKEISTIKFIASSNRIQSNFDHIIEKLKWNVTRRGLSTLDDPPPVRNDVVYIRQPFVGKTSYLIAPLLRKAGYCAAFYTVVNLRNLISHVKDLTPVLAQSGV